MKSPLARWTRAFSGDRASKGSGHAALEGGDGGGDAAGVVFLDLLHDLEVLGAGGGPLKDAVAGAGYESPLATEMRQGRQRALVKGIHDSSCLTGVPHPFNPEEGKSSLPLGRPRNGEAG